MFILCVVLLCTIFIINKINKLDATSEDKGCNFISVLYSLFPFSTSSMVTELPLMNPSCDTVINRELLYVVAAWPSSQAYDMDHSSKFKTSLNSSAPLTPYDTSGASCFDGNSCTVNDRVTDCGLNNIRHSKYITGFNIIKKIIYNNEVSK